MNENNTTTNDSVSAASSCEPIEPPGLSELPKRLREDLMGIFQEAVDTLMDRDDLSEHDARVEAVRILGPALRVPRFAKIHEEYRPAVVAPKRKDVIDAVESAAVQRQPAVRWLRERLDRRAPGSRGRSPSPAASATLMETAFGFGQPLINRTKKTLRSDWPTRWAYDEPTMPKADTTVYSAVQTLVERADNHPIICQSACVEMARQIGEMTDADGNPRYPDFGKHLVVDGTKIPSGHSDDCYEDGILDAGPKCRGVGVGYYGKSREQQENGETVTEATPGEFWIGYKLVVLADMSTQCVLVWKLISPSENERQAVLDCLELLFTLWEDCPAEVIVGDSLYMQSKEFLHKITRGYSMIPVFSTRRGVKQDLPFMPEHPVHPGEWGVPLCKKCDKLMRRHQVDGPITRQKRREYNEKRRAAGKPEVPIGEIIDEVAQIRFHCKDCKTSARTTVNYDPRIYTVWPISSDSETRARREALLVRRNLIESLNGRIKWRGQGNDGHRRTLSATDARMDWQISLHLLYLTGCRLVHLNGAYAKAEQEAREVGALTDDGLPRPDQVAARRLRRSRDRDWGAPAPPRVTVSRPLNHYWNLGHAPRPRAAA